jgi:hypothetical protein
MRLPSGWLRFDPGSFTSKIRVRDQEKRRMIVVLREAIEEVEE